MRQKTINNFWISKKFLLYDPLNGREYFNHAEKEVSAFSRSSLTAIIALLFSKMNTLYMV